MPTTAEKMLAAIRSKLTHVTYLLELKEDDCRHCENVLRDLMGLLEIKQDEEPSEPAENPQETTKQKVAGCYSGDAEWWVPDGIDLHDEETYEHWTRWGTLYIKNLKTNETIHVEMDDGVVFDTKHCDVEILDKDEDF
jgi:hypothetical protein